MAKKTYPRIDSGLEAWDAEINDGLDILESGPIPLWEGAQPAANQNDRAIMAVDQGGSVWRIEFSNGTTWLTIPIQAAALVDFTDNVAGTNTAPTVAAIIDPADTPATADALRDDLVANTIPSIRDALTTIIAHFNTLLANRRTADEQL